ncbi:universal stress protein [Aerococcus urinae]|uniref:Universal stress protein n=1 Tax=Aerococcus urinae TaxID=1376 RepID=A0A0X8FEM0_9LACT|nr:universal stress protein [Aerococcus urinae]AMB95897.1 universal stress protein UspA [Aerococcus urinae]MCY3032484.1 universal stress protein [Aerococcus urinae]MCY3037304.1 universal stress protein [Aerococcus urinae]MCY3044530.1 universal stress protein [Aerococcus urinae]MCY3046125.1 universal stress protein [Aerococcus urinae]
MYKNYEHILTPVDGSDEAELAFKKAVEVALRNDAELIITHIVDTRSIQTTTGYEGTLSDELVKQAKELLNDYKKYASEKGVKEIQTVIDYGSPKVQIAKELSKEYHADLIMIGATGLNAVERLFIGSVSEYVIRNANCDVLVVRTDLDNVKHEKGRKA